MLRRASVLVAFVALACAAAPGAAHMPTIAPGVRAGAIPLAGLTSEPARAKLQATFARAIPVKYGTRRWWAPPQRLGAAAAIDSTVSAALGAQAGASVDLHARWSGSSVRKFVDAVAKSFDRKPVDAQLVRVGSGGPVIREAKPGLAVRRARLARELKAALQRGVRAPIVLPTRPLPAKRTKAKFGPIIWIDRGSNTLRFYNSRKVVRSFRVATGQAIYPTPAGLWSIVVMQYNPWWRPPDSPWAKGLKPIPPGPGNPLGTRWMGLSAAGVGIHGTPDAASIGYSASHGCIRMHIPDAEWLFQHVHIGTPVYIT
jgi:lipoprotein-anchoring transpeptidase ErfK/SrfK